MTSCTHGVLFLSVHLKLYGAYILQVCHNTEMIHAVTCSLSHYKKHFMYMAIAPAAVIKLYNILLTYDYRAWNIVVSETFSYCSSHIVGYSVKHWFSMYTMLNNIIFMCLYLLFFSWAKYIFIIIQLSNVQINRKHAVCVS